MTLVVRNEVEIIRANLDYHLANGVDFAIVTDHGSSDGTSEILREYEQMGLAQVIRDEQPGHHQSRRVTRMVELARREHGADWVINNDADEFWWPQLGSLRDVFASLPDRYAQTLVPRRNFRPVCDLAGSSGNGFAVPQRHRSSQQPDTGAVPHRNGVAGPRHNGTATPGDLGAELSQPFHSRLVYREVCSASLAGQPKVAHRPLRGLVVAPGNHWISPSGLATVPVCGLLEIFHFPMRSYEQFERKVIQTGLGYERLADRSPGVGDDQLELFAMQRAGRLREYYDRCALDDEALAAGLLTGEIVADRRLADFMRELPPPGARLQRSDAPFAQELLASMMSALAEAEQARAMLARVRGENQQLGEQVEMLRSDTATLDARLNEARTDLRSTSEALDLLRGSRLLRHTAWARRLYYRAFGLLRSS